MYAGGLEFPVSIHTKNWLRAPLYSRADLPKHQPKFTKPIPPVGDWRGEEEELMPISRNVLRELCKDLSPEAIPAEIRGFLTSSERPVITESQARVIIDLGMEAKRAAARSTTLNPEVGHNSLYGSDLPHSDHATGSHQIPEPLAFKKAGKEITQPQPETGRSQRAKGAIDIPPQQPKRIRPQKINSPVRILQRSSLQKDTHMPVPIPRDCHSVQKNPQKSVVGRQSANARGQLAIRDNSEPSKKKTSREKVTELQSRKKNMGRIKQAQQKPTKLIVLPPKHVIFKKTAQSTARAKFKVNEAARRAEVNFNKDSLFEVSVEYGLCADIAAGCGFQTLDVEQA